MNFYDRLSAECVDLVAIRAEAIRDAADAIQALHPGEDKNSVKWLRANAMRVARRRQDKSSARYAGLLFLRGLRATNPPPEVVEVIDRLEAEYEKEATS